jgi:hypothetical protein
MLILVYLQPELCSVSLEAEMQRVEEISQEVIGWYVNRYVNGLWPGRRQGRSATAFFLS